MKQRIRLIGAMIGVVVLSVVLGVVLMTGVYAIPKTMLVRNAEKTSPLFEKGSNLQYTNWASGQMYTELADFTDSLMVNAAITRPTDNAMRNAMLSAHAIYPETETQQNLVRFIRGDPGYEYKNYARYWHGYLLYMIPGLCLMDLGQLRILMLFFQFFLAIILLWELGKRSRMLMMLFGFVILFINPITTALTFGEANIYCIMMIQSIIFLRREGRLKEKEYYFLFLMNGICVAFFDLLTYPFVAFGIPMLILLALQARDLKSSLLDILRYGVSWGFGYVGMWAGKWIAGSLITGQNIIGDAANSIQYRTYGQVGDEINYGNTLKLIGRAIYSKPMVVLLLLFILMICYFMIRKGYRFEFRKGTGKNLLPMVILGLSPFAWYLIAMNHSCVHPDITYRELAITVCGIVMILWKLLKKPATDREIGR